MKYTFCVTFAIFVMIISDIVVCGYTATHVELFYPFQLRLKMANYTGLSRMKSPYVRIITGGFDSTTPIRNR